MKLLWTSVVLAILAASLIACGRSESGPAKEPATEPVASPASEPINDDGELIAEETPTQFYSYFQYGTVNAVTCEYAGPLPVVIERSSETEAAGEPVKAQLYLIISPNGLVHERYTELDKNGAVVKKISRMSSWVIRGKEIVFKGLGRGIGTLLYGEKIIQLKIDSDAQATAYRGADVSVSRLQGECFHQ